MATRDMVGIMIVVLTLVAVVAGCIGTGDNSNTQDQQSGTIIDNASANQTPVVDNVVDEANATIIGEDDDTIIVNATILNNTSA